MTTMAQPILTVSSGTFDKKKAQVNLLPCRIHHDGDIDSTEPYWNPVPGKGEYFLHITPPESLSLKCRLDGLMTAYVRGRKLHGKTVKLPEGYYGSVVEKGDAKTEHPSPDEMQNDTEVEELPEAIEVAPLNSKATFDDFIIWGHESIADSGADPYLRSMEEWVSFSEQVCAQLLSR